MGGRLIRRSRALALVGTAVLLLLAGCGGDSGNADTTEAQVSNPGTLLSVGTPAGTGLVLVNFEGKTLYHFTKDQKGGSASACYGRCAKAWPPLITDGEPALRGARAALVGSIERPGGVTQVTYAGWPLYTLARENGAEATGVGERAFGGSWYPLRPNGTPVGK